MTKLAVFDLDGTLADCSHRVPLIPDWDAFFNACSLDQLIVPTALLYSSMVRNDFDWRVEIWSGRNESVRDRTLMWFDDHNLPIPEVLKMRSNNDRRPDHELKKEWLTGATIKPFIVFEDRSRVVQMWRDNGIQTYQVAPGDF